MNSFSGSSRSRRFFIGAGAALLCPGVGLSAISDLSIVMDTRDAPQLAFWAEELKRRIAKWWPIVTEALASPGYNPPNSVIVRFSNALPDTLAGHTVDNVISLNAPYILAHPSYYNYVGHELVHVLQDYPKPFAGWIVEGVADYVRYYVLFPQDRERFFNPQTANFRRGYQPAAAMLDFVERRGGIGSVRRLNAAMRRGEDGELVLARLAGISLDELWTQVVASLTDGAPVPRA
jgi:hypothetical protein